MFRFGPFELDPAEQELRRRGLRLRIPASRMRLLVLLIGRRGQLVSREEIAACLWSDEQAVDVITGINTAINQLRAHLGDDPAAPRYIETIIGSGYRFIAKVTEVDLPVETVADAAREVEEQPTAHAEVEPGSLPIADAAPAAAIAPPEKPEHWLRRKSTLAAVAILLVASPFLILQLKRGSSRQTNSPGELELTRITTTGDIQSADISPDGNYVAFVRQMSGQQTLWLKQLATERVLQLASLGSLVCPGLEFSPDGAYVYFVRKEPLASSGELDRVPFLGGASIKVMDGFSGAPAISPDGRRIAFVRSTLVTHGEDSIVIASIDGSGERTLATYKPPGIHLNRVTWTPDGRFLAFPLKSDVMIIPAGGGTARAIAGGHMSSIDDVWRLPPQNHLIVVGQVAQRMRSQIFEISIEDGKTSAVSHDLSNYDEVRASADGSKLLAVQNLKLSNIEVASRKDSANESGIQALNAQNQNDEGVDGIGWTPDGKLVYPADLEKVSEMMESDAGGPSRPGRVLMRVENERFANPAISPRGDFIAVTRWFEKDQARIWRMDMDGRDQKPLTDGTQDSRPTITPDGAWVVYSSVRGDKSVLMKVPSQGGQALALTDYDSDFPAISPDGKWIACTYIAHPDEPPSLAIVAIGGGSPAKIFKLPETAGPPFSWLPDGHAVSFVNEVDGAGNLWQQPITGGPATPITAFASGRIFNFQWSRDGRLALSRGNETTDAVLITNFTTAR